RQGERWHTTALELSPEAAALAGRRIAGEPAVSALRADGLRLPFPDRAFDAAYTILTLHHFDDASAVALLAEMARVVRRLVIVGGGPAGSAMARLLAQRGRSVTVVDRAAFPRAKPCGECLNPGAVAALERLGLLGSVLALGPARLDGWRVESGGHVAVGTFPRS